MIDLPYFLVIEATEEPDFFGFYSEELEGFSGIGHSVEDCLYRAKWAMKEHKERAPSREVLFNDLMSLMACHAAVRAGDRLTPEQMAALVEQRQLADDTHHCPHGRPTALLFSRHDLERQFRRV